VKRLREAKGFLGLSPTHPLTHSPLLAVSA
jgi:hypothetical protein